VALAHQHATDKALRVMREAARCFSQVKAQRCPMLKLTHIGSVAIAAIFVTALAIDAADARRGGGGGGRGGFSGVGRGGGGFSGGGMRMQGGGRGFANAGRPSHPIAGRPGVGGPGGPGVGGPGVGGPGGGWAGRPGYGGGGWGGYRPGYGYGWGAAAAGAAIGAGMASSAYGDPYYGSYGYYDQQASYTGQSDPIAECARRFKTYDPASQTYIKSKGVRASCP
jgi:hypothetical protein